MERGDFQMAYGQIDGFMAKLMGYGDLNGYPHICLSADSRRTLLVHILASKKTST